MKGKRHFTSVPPPEISNTIHPPSRSQSPVLAMHSTLSAPRMSRRTYALPYNEVRSSNDNTTPCRLLYKNPHTGEPCRMHSRAIYLGTTPRMSIYRWRFGGDCRLQLQCDLRGLGYIIVQNSTSMASYISKSQERQQDCSTPLQSQKDRSVLHFQSRDSARGLVTVQCAANSLTTATAWRELRWVLASCFEVIPAFRHALQLLSSERCQSKSCSVGWTASALQG